MQQIINKIMGFDEYSRVNKQNLKLRNFYKRYFIWGSKEKPGIDLEKRYPPYRYTSGFDKKLLKASSKRNRKILFVLFIFLILIVAITIYTTLL